MSRRERKDRTVYYYRLQVDAREEGAEPLWVDVSGPSHPMRGAKTSPDHHKIPTAFSTS